MKAVLAAVAVSALLAPQSRMDTAIGFDRVNGRFPASGYDSGRKLYLYYAGD